MLRNYSKMAFRHLWKNKLYAGINVLGLAVGITCMLLAILFVKDEYGFDKFHSNASHIYRVTTTLRTEHLKELHTVGGTGQVQGPAFKEAVPEIKNYARVLGGDIYGEIQANNKTLGLQMLFVDESFLEIFTFPLISGNAATALKQINSVVVTESVAMKYFNRTNVVGEMMQLPDDPSARQLGKPMIISAVAKDPPENSSIQFDVLFNMSFANLSFADDNWLNAYMGTFVLLPPDVNKEEVIKKFNAVYQRLAGEQVNKNKQAYGFDPGVSYGLQKLTDIHLDPLPKFSGNREAGIVNESKPVFSYLFLGIAAFILLMAAVNFINISIASSLKRGKEVGIRKITGGSKANIVGRFLVESALLCLISFALALLMTQSVLPLFNELSGKSIALGNSLDLALFFWFLVLLVVIVLSTSLYPSYLLSGFRPTEVLYNKQRLTGNRFLGKSLVVFQFSLAVFFLIATIVYYSQMHFIQTKQLGYDPNDVIYSWVKSDRKLVEVQQLMRDALSKEPTVKAIAFGGDYNLEDVTVNGTKVKAMHKVGDESLLEVSGISLKAGRNFSTAFPSDKARSVLVNEAFVKASGLNTPIGAQVKTSEYFDKDTKTIIGVVADYHFASLREPIRPMVIIMSDWASGGFWVKLEKGKNREGLAAVERAYSKVMPGKVFDYNYVSDTNAAEYKQEQRWKTVIGVATVLSLLICCLGLFGLAHMAIQQRVKEIGIRKVLGASAGSITRLVSGDFLKPVLWSLLVGSPLAGWVMNHWLQNFSYRVDISWWIFLITALVVVIVAMATVSCQAMKAALSDPVESLRRE